MQAGRKDKLAAAKQSRRVTLIVCRYQGTPLAVRTFSSKLNRGVEATMRTTLLSLFIIGSAVFGIASATSASPLSGVRGVSKPDASGVQTVDYRRCWWDDGHRVCRYVYRYRDDDLPYRHRHGWWHWPH